MPLTEGEIQGRMLFLLASDNSIVARDNPAPWPITFCMYDLAGWTEMGQRYRKRALNLTAAPKENETMTAEKKFIPGKIMIGANPDAAEIPPRTRLDMLTPAEEAVWNSVQAVSRCLIEATTLLDLAHENISDYVDGVEPAEEEEPGPLHAVRKGQEYKILGLAADAARPIHTRSVMEIREIALAHAVDIFRGTGVQNEMVLRNVRQFEAYLLGGGVPAKADKS